MCSNRDASSEYSSTGRPLAALSPMFGLMVPLYRQCWLPWSSSMMVGIRSRCRSAAYRVNVWAGSTTWSSTEMIVYFRSRRSGSGRKVTVRRPSRPALVNDGVSSCSIWAMKAPRGCPARLSGPGGRPPLRGPGPGRPVVLGGGHVDADGAEAGLALRRHPRPHRIGDRVPGQGLGPTGRARPGDGDPVDRDELVGRSLEQQAVDAHGGLLLRWA